MEETYLDRLRAEILDLNTKTHKVSEFISADPTFKTLSNIDQQLLVVQLHVMNAYEEILETRIRIASENIQEQE